MAQGFEGCIKANFHYSYTDTFTAVNFGKVLNKPTVVETFGHRLPGGRYDSVSQLLVDQHSLHGFSQSVRLMRRHQQTRYAVFHKLRNG